MSEAGGRRCRSCGGIDLPEGHACPAGPPVGSEPSHDRTMRIRVGRSLPADGVMQQALQELPEGMSVWFDVVEGPARGSVFHIRTRAVIVGREAGDFRIPDPGISRRHASVEVHDSQTIVLRDLSSTNGTYHNGQLIAFSRLQDGDEIRLGSTLITVSVDQSL